MKIQFDVNLNSKKRYLGSGSILSIREFIESCDMRYLIDYDGYACELLLGDIVIWDSKNLYPSDLDDFEDSLLELYQEHDNLMVVWYNR